MCVLQGQLIPHQVLPILYHLQHHKPIVSEKNTASYNVCKYTVHRTHHHHSMVVGPKLCQCYVPTQTHIANETTLL